MNRVGDLQSSEWQHICHQIEKAYKWRTMKTRSNRHAGTDISTIDTPNGFKIVVEQDAYVESLPDLNISPERTRPSGPLSKQAAARRTSLGGHQLGGLRWLAIQTQPQLCS